MKNQKTIDKNGNRSRNKIKNRKKNRAWNVLGRFMRAVAHPVIFAFAVGEKNYRHSYLYVLSRGQD
jgi:hypothetical protein